VIWGLNARDLPLIWGSHLKPLFISLCHFILPSVILGESPSNTWNFLKGVVNHTNQNVVSKMVKKKFFPTLSHSGKTNLRKTDHIFFWLKVSLPLHLGHVFILPHSTNLGRD
jgi:hypothetical protein